MSIWGWWSLSARGHAARFHDTCTRSWSEPESAVTSIDSHSFAQVYNSASSTYQSDDDTGMKLPQSGVWYVSQSEQKKKKNPDFCRKFKSIQAAPLSRGHFAGSFLSDALILWQRQLIMAQRLIFEMKSAWVRCEQFRWVIRIWTLQKGAKQLSDLSYFIAVLLLFFSSLTSACLSPLIN